MNPQSHGEGKRMETQDSEIAEEKNMGLKKRIKFQATGKYIINLSLNIRDAQGIPCLGGDGRRW